MSLPCVPQPGENRHPCSEKRTICSEWFTPLFGEAHHLFGEKGCRGRSAETAAKLRKNVNWWQAKG